MLRGTYEPSIDGLRFVAFLLVFTSHAPLIGGSAVAVWFKAYGWIGVDLFFMLSAYLLFRNLIGEHDRKNRIDIANFYARRVLRIFPLMSVYVLAMLLIFGPVTDQWGLRLAGVLLFFDNIVSWFYRLNGAITATAHLWTLSFEFQFYLVLPLVFAAFVRWGKNRFVICLAIVCVAAALARSYLFHVDIGDPVVYVTPILRPESLFAGLLMAIYRPPWHWIWSGVIGIVAAIAAFSVPQAWNDPLAAVIQYPLAALAFVGLLDLALRCPVVRSITHHWPDCGEW